MRFAVAQLPCCGEEFLNRVVQLLFRYSCACQTLCVIVGSDDETNRATSWASWSARSFPGMSDLDTMQF